ncbi:MAG: FKBP-type peptidyl-prolyl cis-trans isomerase [Lachnospiraceae bacterium]|nr:FKBP-type peptidyl-prolyl cis-trans isomerase [Lachnospiraceae bacterium]
MKNNEKETTELSMSKQRKAERAKKRAADKREKLIWKSAFIAVSVIIAALICVGIGREIYKKATSVTPSSDYSAQLTDNGTIKGVSAKDIVTLPEYKNVTAPLSEIEYDDASVDEEIEGVLSSHQVLNTETKEKIKDGDKVAIEYVGTVDGVAFEGGSTNGSPTDLTIGSGSYIDDFEQQLIGHGVGDEVTVNVTFPEEYGNEELNGKDAQFDVTIDGIYENPEFTDEFVKENLSDKASTVAEYRQYVKDSHYEENLEKWVETYLKDHSEVKSYPKAYLKNLKQTRKYTDQQSFEMMNQMAMSYYGSAMYETFEDYIQMPEAEYDRNLTDECKETEKEDLIYQAILETEGITLTEADYRAYLKETEGSEETFESRVSEYGLGFVMKDFVKIKALEIAKKGVTVQ